jgi:hypothetical protein
MLEAETLSPCWRVTFFACPKKVTKKRAPSHHGLQLPCVAQQNKPVTKLNLAAHTKRELLRDSNSRALYSYFVSATQRDGMGFISPNSHRINANGSKTRLFC